MSEDILKIPTSWQSLPRCPFDSRIIRTNKFFCSTNYKHESLMSFFDLFVQHDLTISLARELFRWTPFPFKLLKDFIFVEEFLYLFTWWWTWVIEEQLCPAWLIIFFCSWALTKSPTDDDSTLLLRRGNVVGRWPSMAAARLRERSI